MKRTIPIEDLNRGAAEEEVVSDDHLRGGELIERIDGEVDCSKGILMRGMSPLEVMITTQQEGGWTCPWLRVEKGQ